MSVQQISIFLENKPGKLAQATRILADNHINLRALSIADTQDFGILRLITAEPTRTLNVLKAADFTTTVTDVLAVAIPDEPGSLAHILELLAEAEVSVEYTYAYTSNKAGTAYMIFRVDDNKKAATVLSAADITVVYQNEIFRD